MPESGAGTKEFYSLDGIGVIGVSGRVFHLDGVLFHMEQSAFESKVQNVPRGTLALRISDEEYAILGKRDFQRLLPS